MEGKNTALMMALSNTERAMYSMILAKYKKRGLGNVRLTKSALRLIQPIQTAQNIYNFPVVSNDASNPLPYEIRLSQFDEFTAWSVAVCLRGTAEPEGGTVTPFVITYAPMELNSINSTLGNLYEGQLSINVNKIDRLIAWDIRRHHSIPRTQFQSSSVGIPAATLPSIDYNLDAFDSLQPMITFSGAKKNTVTISLMNGTIAAAVSSWTVGAVPVRINLSHIEITFRGLLAQNASTFQGGKNPRPAKPSNRR